MTKFSRTDVLKLAKLSRLQLNDTEVDEMVEEVKVIIEYVDRLRNVKLTNLKPTYQVTGLKNVMRDDSVNDLGIKPSELLKNVPSLENGHIKVRRVLE